VLVKGFKKALDDVNMMFLEAAKKQGKSKPEIAIDYKSRNIVLNTKQFFDKHTFFFDERQN